MGSIKKIKFTQNYLSWDILCQGIEHIIAIYYIYIYFIFTGLEVFSGKSIKTVVFRYWVQNNWNSSRTRWGHALLRDLRHYYFYWIKRARIIIIIKNVTQRCFNKNNYRFARPNQSLSSTRISSICINF